ncbi:transglycosylase SLT domain-containing protein [Aliikangiella sp. GXAS 306]|uniref:Transglycosylase SLT domain-containing protein n=1 Tax=Aliikangiella maris TaxID=3162458 RepID=A0ABV3MTU9_9GAMM
MRAEVPPFYKMIAKEQSVPEALLYSIALQESGYSFYGKRKPWPWTLNICGKGIYLDSKKEAEEFLREAVQVGCSVDVGLFQIHWQTHHNNFSSFSQALDPIYNMRVGAHILFTQYQKSHDWFLATGHYHSPNNKARASNYRDSVYKILAKVIQ